MRGGGPRGLPAGHQADRERRGVAGHRGVLDGDAGLALGVW